MYHHITIGNKGCLANETGICKLHFLQYKVYVVAGKSFGVDLQFLLDYLAFPDSPLNRGSKKACRGCDGWWATKSITLWLSDFLSIAEGMFWLGC